MRFDNCRPSYKDMFTKAHVNDWKPVAGTTGFTFTGSGKGALSIVLHYLKEKGILPNKMSSVLVPQWIGVAVYQTMITHCFPSTQYSNDTRAIIAYHQYGFPQDMEKLIDFCENKKLVLIEDCAHTIDSKYKGIPVGTLGSFSIHSFSKFLFCFALGGVSFKEHEFMDFYLKKQSEAPFFLMAAINLFKAIDESLIDYHVNFEKLRMMFYSLYPKSFKSSLWARNLLFKKLEEEIARRKKNYLHLREGLCNYDFISNLDLDVVPYAVPLLVKDGREKIVEKIKSNNIECGEYWFDVNRFVVSPKFEKCVLVPIHSKMTLDEIDFIISAVKAHCKK